MGSRCRTINCPCFATSRSPAMRRCSTLTRRGASSIAASIKARLQGILTRWSKSGGSASRQPSKNSCSDLTRPLQEGVAFVLYAAAKRILYSDDIAHKVYRQLMRSCQDKRKLRAKGLSGKPCACGSRVDERDPGVNAIFAARSIRRGQMKIAKAISLSTLAILMSTSALAESSGRNVVDPESVQFGKIAGELTIPGKPNLAGNAFFVGADGCQIISNYHVVFADSVDSVSKKIKLVTPRSAGYEVNFAFDLDGQSGKFRHSAKAVTIELANYDQVTTEGLTQDMVLLRLTPCAGKEFAGPELDHPEQGEFVPTGKLTTISTYRKDKDTAELFVEAGCVSAPRTAVAGLFFSNCYVEPGMSGSMILTIGAAGKSRLVGITIGKRDMEDGSVISVAVHASSITPFVEFVLGAKLLTPAEN